MSKNNVYTRLALNIKTMFKQYRVPIGRGYFMKDARTSDYFDTKYMTVLRIEKNLHNFEDQKFACFF